MSWPHNLLSRQVRRTEINKGQKTKMASLQGRDIEDFDCGQAVCPVRIRHH